MKRILVATDGSDGSDRAVDYAALMAKDNGADLLIVNVIGGDGFFGNMFERITDAQTVWLKELFSAESARLLTRARDRARRIGDGAIQLESRTGDVALTIIDIAREKQADVIVVSKRGAGRIGELLLGSIAQKLVSLAPLPVIVVP
jgi:nucleotide-binding universal stress UspA family protein